MSMVNKEVTNASPGSKYNLSSFEALLSKLSTNRGSCIGHNWSSTNTNVGNYRLRGGLSPIWYQITILGIMTYRLLTSWTGNIGTRRHAKKKKYSRCNFCPKNNHRKHEIIVKPQLKLKIKGASRS